ncbi:hypothetical protein BMETH_1841_0 [methanotrophic bacterial endosymbiont of Bathymodiolus sp.]|nr:hypothetical protein BMETH_1841_0 [methanotrophic bacterial endosymbiont of Bathymodiolus sp.]
MISKFKEETPPRAWGRLGNNINNAVRMGNTPTGVGKTYSNDQTPPTKRKHPHGRGEDPFHPEQL